MSLHYYGSNEGIFKVKLLHDNGFTADIELLEPITYHAPRGILIFEKGTILHVGNWQVKKTRKEVEDWLKGDC